MAIIIKGKTTCPLCKQVIEEDHKVIAFSAFLPEDHYLYKFSDEAFHEDCLKKHEKYEELIKVYKGFNELYEQRPLPTKEEMEDFDTWYKNSAKVKNWLQELENYIEKSRTIGSTE